MKGPAGYVRETPQIGTLVNVPHSDRRRAGSPYPTCPGDPLSSFRAPSEAQRNVHKAVTAATETGPLSPFRSARELSAQIEKKIGLDDGPYRKVDSTRMLAVLQYMADATVQDVIQREKTGKLTLSDRKNAAMAVSMLVEKALLVAGKPTAIVAESDNDREALPRVLEKLARVGKLVALPAKDGPRAPAPGPLGSRGPGAPASGSSV